MTLADALRVDQLRSHIRRTVARRQADLASSSAGAGRGLPGPNGDAATGAAADAPRSADWSTIVAALNQAEQHGNIGRRLPPVPARVPRPLRFLVRWLAWATLGFLRYVLTEQREFNYAVLGCLRALQTGLYRTEQKAAQLGLELARLREAAVRGEQSTAITNFQTIEIRNSGTAFRADPEHADRQSRGG